MNLKLYLFFRGPKNVVERAQHRSIPTAHDWHLWADLKIPLERKLVTKVLQKTIF